MTRPAGISGAIASSASTFAARRQFRIRPFDLAEPGLFDVRPTRNHMRFRQLPDQIFALRQQGRQVMLFDTRTGFHFPFEQPHRNLLEQNRTELPRSWMQRNSAVPSCQAIRGVRFVAWRGCGSSHFGSIRGRLKLGRASSFGRRVDGGACEDRSEGV
ncbi:hypothetical protein [Nocardia xishanensis]